MVLKEMGGLAKSLFSLSMMCFYDKILLFLAPRSARELLKFILLNKGALC